jgi:hypothetical protein
VTFDGTQNFFIKASIMTDPHGNTFMVGATINPAGNYDLFLAKYGEGGVIIWPDQYGGAGNRDDVATAFVIEPSGNLYITGSSFSSSRVVPWTLLQFDITTPANKIG